MAKDGAEGKDMQDQFGIDGIAQEKVRNPDRSTNVHDAGVGGQKVDKTGTPGAERQWPASQPDSK